MGHKHDIQLASYDGTDEVNLMQQLIPTMNDYMIRVLQIQSTEACMFLLQYFREHLYQNEDADDQ